MNNDMNQNNVHMDNDSNENNGPGGCRRLVSQS